MKRIILFATSISLFALLSTISCKKDDNKDDNKDSAFKCGTSTIKDVDGNVYNTVLIGDQCWMKENLKTTRDASGNQITRYCYDGNTDNCNLYGGLYTWATLMNGSSTSNTNPSDVQGICPRGWHIPSDKEWTELTDYYMKNTTVSACKLKSCRQINSPLGKNCNTNEHPRWEEHDTYYGTNESGFSALPGGFRKQNGDFGRIGLNGHWWQATEYSQDSAWFRTIYYHADFVLRYSTTKNHGFSVRCLRD